MITKDQVPAWLADMSDKLGNKDLKRWERENVRSTLLTIREFVDSRLKLYDRDFGRKVEG